MFLKPDVRFKMKVCYQKVQTVLTTINSDKEANDFFFFQQNQY